MNYSIQQVENAINLTLSLYVAHEIAKHYVRSGSNVPAGVVDEPEEIDDSSRVSLVILRKTLDNLIEDVPEEIRRLELIADKTLAVSDFLKEYSF